ncbi:hypothetical protein DFH11DRAFT_197716 [Phellopilus nigrolimitatus]|nr:hypothetical protein DFH11DRAFT_197716 [Phellopilus nigrolimitatus]
MRVRPVFCAFADLKQSSLMWKIWAANSLDIILDFVLTFVSVLFNYSGLFLPKCIINAIDTDSPAAHMRAYLFAALMFGAHVLKAEANVQHLWFGRRAAVRIRSQLMSAIYDKALKRSDFSGVVKMDAKDAKVDGEEGNKIKVRNRDKKAEKKEKDRKEKADDPKAVGKIVNLMALVTRIDCSAGPPLLASWCSSPDRFLTARSAQFASRKASSPRATNAWACSTSLSAL